jgi:ABC-type transport system involved in multi-copper enzyme maturation permease subunit
VIRLAPVAAIAQAELRATRRLVRYWVFFGLVYFFGIFGIGVYWVMHSFFSSYSATVAAMSPRYLAGMDLGTNYLITFIIGIIFLGFDIRARDRRDRMLEVLDSRPYTNLELLTGRFAGLLLAAWVPAAVLVLLIQTIGWLLRAVGSPVGDTLQPTSALALLTFMAVPAFSFTLAMVFLVTLLVRVRLVAAVLMIGFVGGLGYMAAKLPLDLAAFWDLAGSFTLQFPSDVVPGISQWYGWVQRLALVIAAAAMLVFAAAIHPRLDGGSRVRKAGGAAVLLAVAIALMAVCTTARKAPLRQLEAWRTAHEAHADEAIPDVVSISGAIEIDPGDELAIDLNLVYSAPVDRDLPHALFTLNPGLEVGPITDGDGSDVPFAHANGLLVVDRAAARGERVSLNIEAEGKPDTLFAYLDEVRTPEAINPMLAMAFLLGIDRAVFDDRFVALMPDMGWLPIAGAGIGGNDPRRRPRDYFEIDLEVELPDRWLAAGPGRRREVAAGEDDNRFRFSPGAPIHEAALVASRFAAVSADIEGFRVEVLLHPSHDRIFGHLEDAAGELQGWVAERFRDAAELGLPYPYDGLTVVEVPASLRGFAGGWRLDTSLAPPTMVMIRESGIPTARFDVPFRNPRKFQDREGGVARAKVERLRTFTINDYLGGNILVGAARNFVLGQTSAAGAASVPVNFVLEELTTMLLTDSRGYFSVHWFTPEIMAVLDQTGRRVALAGSRDIDPTEVVIDSFSKRPEVWSAVLGGSLEALDPWQDPRKTLDALTLKGGALAKSLYDSVDRSAAGQLLAVLRERFRGRTFDIDDFVAAGKELDEDFGLLMEDWLTTTVLPGFVAGDTRLFRLPDGDGGNPRYQLITRIRNNESVPGVVRVHRRVVEGGEREDSESDPIRIAGDTSIEYGVVLSNTPTAVWVEPYLSLNRVEFVLQLEPVDEQRIVREEPFDGVREVDWVPSTGGAVVVDDLDDGFSVSEGDDTSGFRIGGRGIDFGEDEGLPIFEFGKPPGRWSRAVASSAWGTYRHTVAIARAGSGRRTASFAASIPSAGGWELQIHLPEKRRFFNAKSWGVWKLAVEDSSGSRDLVFDADDADRGWSTVGEVVLTRGDVNLELSDDTDGEIVVADAIRWVPVEDAAVADATDAD